MTEPGPIYVCRTGLGDTFSVVERPDGWAILKLDVAGISLRQEQGAGAPAGYPTREAVCQRAAGICDGIRWALEQDPDSLALLAYDHQLEQGDDDEAPGLILLDSDDVDELDDDPSRARCVSCGRPARLAACEDENLCHACADAAFEEPRTTPRHTLIVIDGSRATNAHPDPCTDTDTDTETR